MGLDRNPVRRRTDRFEDALRFLTAVTVLGVGPVLAWQAGENGYRDAVLASRHEGQAHLRVPAVLQDDAIRHVSFPADGQPLQASVPARWHAPDGTVRTGSVIAEPGARTGSTVLIWTDIHGSELRPPVLPAPWRDALERGMVVLVGVTAGAAWIRRKVLRGIHRRRMESWQIEWLLVEPGWSGRW
jgi:hypothetical protein